MDFIQYEVDSLEDEVVYEDIVSVDSSGVSVDSSATVQLLVAPEFISGSDELQATLYTTNSLLFIVIIILCFMFIRTILLSIRGRFFNG